MPRVTDGATLDRSLSRRPHQYPDSHQRGIHKSRCVGDATLRSLGAQGATLLMDRGRGTAEHRSSRHDPRGCRPPRHSWLSHHHRILVPMARQRQTSNERTALLCSLMTPRDRPMTLRESLQRDDYLQAGVTRLVERVGSIDALEALDADPLIPNHLTGRRSTMRTKRSSTRSAQLTPRTSAASSKLQSSDPRLPTALSNKLPNLN